LENFLHEMSKCKTENAIIKYLTLSHLSKKRCEKVSVAAAQATFSKNCDSSMNKLCKISKIFR